MAIPKVIYQTYKTSRLPLIFKWHIYWLKKKNVDYNYQFYDDNRVDRFILNEFGEYIYNLFKSINIGAVKADFFRYAILYKKGGIYLDIDSRILWQIDDFINPTDKAVISYENNEVYFIQYALFFEANHPFLKKVIDLVIDNLKNNRYPNDSHKMTGPSVFTTAINDCLNNSSNIEYRVLGVDYENKVQFSFKGSKTFLYGFFKKNHWKKLQKTVPIINNKNISQQ